MSSMHFHEWNQVEGEAQEEWSHNPQATGSEWDEVKDAARYGWDAAAFPEFRGKSFEDVEADLRSHWSRPEEASEEESWDYVRDAVKMGYNKGKSRFH